MKKLNTKLAFAIVFSFVIATLIPRVVVVLLNISVPHEFVDSPIVLIGGLLSSFLALSIFALISNMVLMKRIKLLQAATERVKQGVYSHHIVASGNDELSSLIHTFNDMQQALLSNNYMNREFIRNMSHQYKTPLMVMSSYLHELKDNDMIKSRLLAQINHLSTLTSTLLTLSKVDSLEHLSFKPTNITELVRRQIIAKQPLWEAKACEWDYIGEEDCSISTYEPYVYEMVSNLLDNMIQFAYANSILRVEIKKQDQHCWLIFCNHGPMLTEYEQAHMFDLFFKGKHSDGTGVGLNLVKSILKCLHGSLSVSSDEFETRFTVLLSLK